MKRVFNWFLWLLKIVPIKCWIGLVLTAITIFFANLSHIEGISEKNIEWSIIYFGLAVFFGVVGLIPMIVFSNEEICNAVKSFYQKITQYYSNWWADKPR